MNQKVAFFMLLNWSLFSFASHHRERIQEAQEFMQPDAVWFKVIRTETAYRDLILECHRIAHNPNLEGNIDFEQTELGILSVVYEQQRQQLGHFPT